MRGLGTILWALVLSALVCQPASAGTRIALVIGNSAYRNVTPLTNPANDAAAMAETFKRARFDVVDVGSDLPVSQLRRLLRDFGAKARDADVAVIYYAGHGIEVDGTNYLVPIDAQLETDADVYDEALSLDRVLVAVEPAKQLRLVILDACRDNPFAKTMKRTIASRAIGRGLAKVEPANPNTMIAYAAKAGFTALDGDGKNSPFAVALSQHLMTPGLDLRKAFGFVRDDVLKATNNRQEPFIYGSLGGNDVSLVPAPAVAAPAAPAVSAQDPNASVRHDYELAAQVGTRDAWDSFIAAYPDGFYGKLAIAQRNKLIAEEARVAATEKARRAADEQARLTAEGAKATERAKADADARAAEQARLEAEKKKAIEDAKLADAERGKAAAQAKADEDARKLAAKAKLESDAKAAAAAKAAEAQRIADEAKAADAEKARLAAQTRAAEEEAKLAAAKARLEALQQAKAAEDARRAEAERSKPLVPDGKPIGQVAALTPPAEPDRAAAVASDVPRLLQTELRRVGCNTGAVDGNWNAAAQNSLALFNKHAGTTLDVKLASLDALDVVKSRKVRICPLVCDRGFKADGDNCVKIVCKPGYQVGAANTCEKIGGDKPVAKRDAPAAPDAAARPQAAPGPPKQVQSSGQFFCNQQGCRAVRAGCYIARDREGSCKGCGQREICP